jgi:hypothetical protein
MFVVTADTRLFAGCKEHRHFLFVVCDCKHTVTVFLGQGCSCLFWGSYCWRNEVFVAWMSLLRVTARDAPWPLILCFPACFVFHFLANLFHLVLFVSHYHLSGPRQFVFLPCYLLLPLPTEQACLLSGTTRTWRAYCNFTYSESSSPPGTSRNLSLQQQ